jgi:opacity protein-like surface antigen
MKRIRTAALGVVILMLAASAAFAGEKGSTMFAIQLTNGTADLYDPTDAVSKYISAYDHSEIGAQVQAWHFLTNDYAMTVAFGLGMFSETNKPGNSPAPTDLDFKYTQSSFNVRVGGDRVVNLGDAALVYFGPGIEYWSGSAKFDSGTAATTFKSEDVTRYSLSSRIGVVMRLSESVGLGCHMGRRIGFATADDDGRKATWWPSSFEGAGGIVLNFGS